MEGSLGVKLPTICRDGKAEVGRVSEEKSRSEKQRDGESQKREDAGARKGRKVAIHCVFPKICGSGGSKSNLSKAEPDERWKIARRCGAKHISKSKCIKHANVGPLLEVEMSKKCTSLWREAHFHEAHFQVKMYKTHHSRTTFGSWAVENVHAVVARSTFPSQNVQNTPAPHHFSKLRCRKSARRCGAKHISTKHISKSKGTRHTILGPLLEVELLKKCTPLWREAHFQVKMYKTHHSRTTFGSWDVENVHAVVARSTFASQKCKKLRLLSHFLTFSCCKSGQWLIY